MIINKPKKSDQNSYICTISTDEKKTYSIQLDNCHIVDINDQYIYIKTTKSDLNTFYDINSNIIQIVKDNCTSWFNNNMNMNLVEEYFINTLVYKKNIGDLLKIKLIPESDLNLDINSDYSMRLTLKHLRFYKQKFVIEFTIKSIKSVNNTLEIVDDSASEYSDTPEPNESDIEYIRNECLTKLDNKIDYYNTLKNTLVNSKIPINTLNIIDNISSALETNIQA